MSMHVPARLPALGHLLAAALVAVALLATVVGPVRGAATDRLSGSGRFETAVAVSQHGYPGGADNVWIANGDAYADALAAGPAAGAWQGPVLLAGKDGLPSTTAAEIRRLAPDRIFVVGGKAVISNAVLAALDDLATLGAMRISGQDRFETSAAISDAVWISSPEVAIATGRGFADAVSASPAFSAASLPILLTEPGSLPSSVAEELARLDPDAVTIMGGEGAVSGAVIQQIRAAIPGPEDIVRFDGVGRYHTNASFIDAVWGGADTVYLATGEDFPDALTGGPVAGLGADPIALVGKHEVPDPVACQIARLDPSTVIALGGTAVVSNAVLQAASDPATVADGVDCSQYVG